jgi:hypothetical protein
MRRTPAILALIISSSGLTVLFTNCGGELPPGMKSYLEREDASHSPSLSPLTFSISPGSISLNQPGSFVTHGGKPPYSYRIVSGTASLNGDSGIFSSTAGPVLVEVIDSQNRTAMAAASVYPGTAGGTTGQCVTPWQQTVANGQQVIGFGASQVECPAVCQPQTVTCTNGVLTVGGVSLIGGGGTATVVSANCSVASCRFKRASYGLCARSGALSVASLPPTCSTAEFHTYICLNSAADNVPSEYICAGPNEPVTSVPPAPSGSRSDD